MSVANSSILLAVIAAMGGGCLSTPSVMEVPLCDLSANETQYVGRTVRTSGIFTFNDHEVSNLTDPSCPNEGLVLRFGEMSSVTEARMMLELSRLSRTSYGLSKAKVEVEGKMTVPGVLSTLEMAVESPPAAVASSRDDAFDCADFSNLPTGTTNVTVNWYTDGLDLSRYYWPGCPDGDLMIDISRVDPEEISIITRYSASRKAGNLSDYVLIINLEGEKRFNGRDYEFVARRVISAQSVGGVRVLG